MTGNDAFDTAAVARMTGVTSRTLRHYDAIGLLTPAWTAGDGRRYYTEPELLRLQHILVLRSLGTALERISRIVATEDKAEVLALLDEHCAGLEAERDRYARLASTVRHTIASLQKGQPMAAEEIFEGFDHAEYEAEVRERWSGPRVDSSNDAWKALGKDGQSAHLAEHNAIAEALAGLAAQDVPPDDARVQQLVARHHAWVSLFWVPDADAYAGLGQMYASDHRFRANYDKFGDGTTDLLRDAIEVYSIETLA